MYVFAMAFITLYSTFKAPFPCDTEIQDRAVCSQWTEEVQRYYDKQVH